MGKLEDLRKFIKQQFENAETKEQIDTLAKINTGFDEVEKEQQLLESRNAELIKSYKDLVQHTSFKDDNKLVGETNPVGEAPSLEKIVAQFIEK